MAQVFLYLRPGVIVRITGLDICLIGRMKMFPPLFSCWAPWPRKRVTFCFEQELTSSLKIYVIFAKDSISTQPRGASARTSAMPWLVESEGWDAWQRDALRRPVLSGGKRKKHKPVESFSLLAAPRQNSCRVI